MCKRTPGPLLVAKEWAAARRAYDRSEGEVEKAERLDRAEDNLLRVNSAYTELLAACEMVNRELSDPRLLAVAIPRMRATLDAAIAKATGSEG